RPSRHPRRPAVAYELKKNVAGKVQRKTRRVDPAGFEPAASTFADRRGSAPLDTPGDLRSPMNSRKT
ncbi:hypothetical protein, partial [Methanoculleus sp.]|uniref:hypothetical protein n=1 Tax=Methanoculleus sp. TaxID=90427 RepID=UPI0025E52C54